MKKQQQLIYTLNGVNQDGSDSRNTHATSTVLAGDRQFQTSLIENGNKSSARQARNSTRMRSLETNYGSVAAQKVQELQGHQSSMLPQKIQELSGLRKTPVVKENCSEVLLASRNQIDSHSVDIPQIQKAKISVQRVYSPSYELIVNENAQNTPSQSSLTDLKSISGKDLKLVLRGQGIHSQKKLIKQINEKKIVKSERRKAQSYQAERQEQSQSQGCLNPYQSGTQTPVASVYGAAAMTQVQILSREMRETNKTNLSSLIGSEAHKTTNQLPSIYNDQNVIILPQPKIISAVNKSRGGGFEGERDYDTLTLRQSEEIQNRSIKNQKLHQSESGDSGKFDSAMIQNVMQNLPLQLLGDSAPSTPEPVKSNKFTPVKAQMISIGQHFAHRQNSQEKQQDKQNEIATEKLHSLAKMRANKQIILPMQSITGRTDRQKTLHTHAAVTNSSIQGSSSQRVLRDASVGNLPSLRSLVTPGMKKNASSYWDMSSKRPLITRQSSLGVHLVSQRFNSLSQKVLQPMQKLGLKQQKMTVQGDPFDQLKSEESIFSMPSMNRQTALSTIILKDFSKKTIGSDSQPLFENLHQPSSRDMTTRSNYEATSQLMSFIKAKNAGNMALKSTKDSLNKNQLHIIPQLNLDYMGAELQCQQSNENLSMLGSEQSCQFKPKYPLKATRMKNNYRRYENLIKDQKSHALKTSIHSYIDDKNSKEAAAADEEAKERPRESLIQLKMDDGEPAVTADENRESLHKELPKVRVRMNNSRKLQPSQKRLQHQFERQDSTQNLTRVNVEEIPQPAIRREKQRHMLTIENVRMNQFITAQPSERLREMVQSKSAYLSTKQPEDPQEYFSTEIQSDATIENKKLENASTITPKKIKPVNAVKRNKSELKKLHFMRDRQKRYCEDSGLPTQEEIDDYHRTELLKDVEKDKKFMKLNQGGKIQQLIKLKAIEQAPDMLPDAQHVLDYKSQTKIISQRMLRIVNGQTKAESQEQQQNLAKKLGQIASMLEDMHVPTEIKDGEEEESSVKESPQALENDFMAVLEQRNILKEYCRQFKNIKVQEHRAYWETIKRVHAKIDKREQHQFEHEQFLKKTQEQKLLKQEIARQREEKIRRIEESTAEQRKNERQLVEKESRRIAFEKRFKASEDYTSYFSSSDSSDNQEHTVARRAKDTFNKMHRRVLREVKKRDLSKRTSKLIAFQKKLIAEFDAIQYELSMEDEDMRDIDFDTITEAELEALMVRRLDHRLFDIFLRTELFYQYHQEVEANLEQMKVGGVSKNLAKEQNQRIEQRIELQMKELIPKLRPSAQMISQSGSQVSPAPDTNSAKAQEEPISAEFALKDIKLQLRENIKQRMLKSQREKNQYLTGEIVEQQSQELSESSNYLDTIPASSSGSDYEDKVHNLLKLPASLHDTMRIESRDQVQPSISLQQIDRGLTQTEINSPAPYKGRQSPSEQTVTLEPTEFFNPSNSFYSQNSSAVGSSKLLSVERQLLKRKVVPVDNAGIGAFRQHQSELVSAFSKTIARNLHQSINTIEEQMTNKVSKQLLRRAEFAKDFKYVNMGSGSDSDNHETKGISKAVKTYQMRVAIEKDEVQQRVHQKEMNEINQKVQLQLKHHYMSKVSKKSTRKQQREQYGTTGQKEAAGIHSRQASLQTIKTEKSVTFGRAYDADGDVVKFGDNKLRSVSLEPAPPSKIKEDTANMISSNLEGAFQRGMTLINTAVKQKASLFGSDANKKQMKERVRRVLQQDKNQIKRDIPEQQAQLLVEARRMKKQLMKAQFVDNVIKAGSLPLPILNKIENKFLFLENYQIEPANFNKLSEALAKIIPASLNKIVFINNLLNDQSVAMLFNNLASLNNGPEVVAISHNSLDAATIEPTVNFLRSDAAVGLKRFIIKDPISHISSGIKRKNIEPITRVLTTQGSMMYRLKELVLQKIGMTQVDILNLCEFLRMVGSLKVLNLAANGLTQSNLIPMFETLQPQAYQITHLSLAWNSMQDDNSKIDTTILFRKKFSDFLRHSRTLQHIDLNGLSFSEPTLEYITQWGFQKAKTLLSIHMSGNFSRQNLLGKFRKWMKVIKTVRKIARNDTIIEETKIKNQLMRSMSQLISLGSSPKPLLALAPTEEISQDESNRQQNRQDIIHDFRQGSHSYVKSQFHVEYKEALRMHNVKQAANITNDKKFEKEMRKSAFEVDVMDRIVFQRFLGHHEIINGYRWQEVDESDCYLCNHWSYCVFLYDMKLAATDEIYMNIAKKKINDVRDRSLSAPIFASIESIGQILPMISVQHFLSRLAMNQTNGTQRHLKQTILENERSELTERVNQFEKKLHKVRKVEELKGVGAIAKPLKWHYLLTNYLKNIVEGVEPQGTIDLQNYNLMDLYEQSCKDESLFLCAAYLPPKMTSVIVQDQRVQFASVSIMAIEPQKFKKLPLKCTKKVQGERKFNKSNSVFKDFKQETEEMSRKQLDYDQSNNKLNRFIKDPDEMQRTYDVILKYYRPVRDQFFYQISNSETYPVIDWLDFTNFCLKWNVYDDYLKGSDVDRIFIATNVELEDQEGNDDRSLCRFEFYEIITRMAKRKYLENKNQAVQSMSEAVERILLECVLPNCDMPMDSVRWREVFLYNLPVDDLLKANMDSLKKVFDKLKMRGIRAIDLKSMLAYIATLPLEVSLDTITLAYSFSKIQVVDELEQIDKYNQLVFVEYLEFLGRLAWLTFDNKDEYLDVKLWRLLQIFFGPIERQVQAHEEEEGVDSESDYEDDLATEIFTEKHPRDIYAGFGLLNNSQLKKSDKSAATQGNFNPGRDYTANLWAKPGFYRQKAQLMKDEQSQE